jgi:hypothetical protein
MSTDLTPVPGAEPRFDDEGHEIVDVATCGVCGRSWNDAAVSSVTPVPSGRCPFEYEHDEGIAERLEHLRQELRAERISYHELAELQSLAEHIEPGDVELLEAAGVPEHDDDDDAAAASDFNFTLRLGNAAMQTNGDVADALRRTADLFARYGSEPVVPERAKVRDLNGNTVGEWTVE